MLQTYVTHRDANLYINGAVSLGIEVEIISSRWSYARLHHNGRELLIGRESLSCNSLPGLRFSSNKALTWEVMHKNGIPVPEQCCFRMTEINDDVLDRMTEKFPVVVKPVSLSQGKGVTTNIRSRKKLAAAINSLKKLGVRNVVFERHIDGSDYRVIVFRGTIIDVVRRIPAHVTGDGSTSVRELIQQKNLLRKKYHIPQIQLSSKKRLFLKQGGKNFDSIPDRSEFVQLDRGCYFHAGGETQRIDLDSIPEENKDMFRKVQKISWLDLCAIDYMSRDIRQPYHEAAAMVNEVNSSPNIYINVYAGYREDLAPITRILRLYFEI